MERPSLTYKVADAAITALDGIYRFRHKITDPPIGPQLSEVVPNDQAQQEAYMNGSALGSQNLNPDFEAELAEAARIKTEELGARQQG